MTRSSSRPEAAFVLLTMQALLWTVAGVSALPFALAGEVYMVGLGLASMLLALATCLLAIGILWRPDRARRSAMRLEIACLARSLFLLLVPIGANSRPGAWTTNV